MIPPDCSETLPKVICGMQDVSRGTLFLSVLFHVKQNLSEFMAVIFGANTAFECAAPFLVFHVEQIHMQRASRLPVTDCST